MYIPKHYKISDWEEIREFVQHHSFATLVTTKGVRPIATHLPMQLLSDGEDTYLTGHMAYGNPQWRTLKTSGEVLVMFQGPHAYISSSWYEQENVPTWNYQSVHLYGEAAILSEDELRQDLAGLLKKYENHREDPVLWNKISPSILEKELKGIVGFKIRVTEVQAAFKMSQNRNATDYRNIIDQLNKEEDPGSKQMAGEMENRTKKI